ncbi:hypothetical protein PFNF135_05505 [Plasmodium falciparum NF135/5.C10]|uniref:Plasmodium falciparum erythrocyte membrane protein 1 acidic terminal segment domain-containing protein n=1 Tax=Plasmodium falciparum NF135/5.C10 TaxID=1036726 RepID=W4I8X9_PLAFA|nr:hypothetical protein PFNF135_05505 [Plasmodium falciparum NF135/5.C10]
MYFFFFFFFFFFPPCLDELNDLDNISISDLSDVDPETNNIIIGVCDKVERSHHFVVLICICYIYVYFFYF